jgi:predicted RNA-binding Zn-ribbon protein involved in translation (DUF1610 family)
MISTSQCKSCGTKVECEIENVAIGQTVPCPSCGEQIALNTEHNSAPPIPPKPEKPRTINDVKNKNSPPVPKLWRCNVCQEPMSRDAHTCPNCGDPKKSPVPGFFYLVGIVYLIIGAIILLGIANYILGMPFR